MTNVYDKADSRITDLLAWLALKFSTLRKKTSTKTDSTAVFDELDVIYKQLLENSRTVFMRILQDAYDAEAEETKRQFTDDFLLLILDEPNELSTVVFTNELARRSEKFAEQITAAITRTLQSEDRTNENGVVIPLETELEKIFRTELRSVSLLLDTYSIYAVDKAREQAMLDDGVNRVRWVTIMDGNECEYCKKLNGRVFPIDRIPTKPHLRCRCYTIRFD